jgi:hypothetical protein
MKKYRCVMVERVYHFVYVEAEDMESAEEKAVAQFTEHYPDVRDYEFDYANELKEERNENNV